MLKEFKIWEGVNVITDEETHFCESPSALWQLFGWDVEGDQNARDCATEINMQLFCFHFCDLTALNNGKKLLLEVVPCKD